MSQNKHLNFVHIKQRGCPKVASVSSIYARGQTNKQIIVVGLVAFHSRLVADGLTAFVASVDDDKSLFGVGQGLYGTKDALTLVGSVAGIDVHVERAEAEGTVISRGVAKGQNFLTTVLAYKA